MSDIVMIFGIPFECLNEDDWDVLEELQGEGKFPEGVTHIIPYTVAAFDPETSVIGFVIEEYWNFTACPVNHNKISEFMNDSAEEKARILKEFMILLPESVAKKATALNPDLLLFMHNDD